MATGYVIADGKGTAGQVLQSQGSSSPAAWTTPTSGIGGSIAATQVAFGSGANTVNGSAAMTFSANTNTLAVNAGTNYAMVATGQVGVNNVLGEEVVEFEPELYSFNVKTGPSLDPNPGYVTTVEAGQVAIVQTTDSTHSASEGGANLYPCTLQFQDFTAGTLPPTITSLDASSNPNSLDLQIAALKINGAPGTAGQVLISQGSGAAPVWGASPPASIARVYTVGVESSTIQGCINLCTNPSDTNAYIIRIPPGQYTENLTLKGSVQLQGMTNPNDTATVKITGNHTFNGTNVNPVTNRVTIANIIFSNTSATAPTFDLTATVASQINIFGCFLQNVNTATTPQILKIGSLVTCYLTNVVSRMAPTAGQGGTHVVNNGGTLYCVSGVDFDGGTRVLDVIAASYSQFTNSQLVCASASGGEVIRISYVGTPTVNGVVGLGYCSVANNAATGNGVNLAGANATVYAAFTTFNVQNSATTYVITGVSPSYFLNTTNNYSNVAGLVTRNVKIKTTVTAAAYTTALTPTA